MGFITLFGKRVEPIRAWTMATIFTIETIGLGLSKLDQLAVANWVDWAKMS